MFDLSLDWDRYRTRYSGYCPETLDGFVERGVATYDAATDTYTVRCDHYGHAATDCAGTFTVSLSPEFA